VRKTFVRTNIHTSDQFSVRDLSIYFSHSL
jgi:hypothetical protein